MEIPVLPLSKALLFPDGLLPIPIKNNRAGILIRDVLTAEKEIGIIYAKRILDAKMNEKPVVGCIGIIEMYEKLPFGRMNVLLRGGRRFRVNRFNQALPYLRAEIDYIDDSDFMLTDAEKMRVARQLYQNIKIYLRAILKCEDLNLHWKFDELNLNRLINQAAMYLDMSLAEKQTILEISSLEKRYQHISKFIEEGLAVARFRENRMCIFENPILN